LDYQRLAPNSQLSSTVQADIEAKKDPQNIDKLLEKLEKQQCSYLFYREFATGKITTQKKLGEQEKFK